MRTGNASRSHSLTSGRVSRGRLCAGLCLGWLLLQSGCAAGPDYERPDLEGRTPDAWLTEATDATETDLSAWWAAMGDPELITLIEFSLSNSLDLREARERIVSARARRGIRNADRLPTLDAEASYQRLESGDDGFVLAGPPPGVGIDLYSLGAVAGWELDLWGRVGRLVEAADAEIEFAVEDERASRVALAAEVAREFVLIRSLDLELALVRSTLEADQDTLDIADARERAGFGNALDVARAARVREANRALVPALESRRAAAELRLAVLAGVLPGEVTVSGRGLPLRDVVPARGVPADLVLRRPDLRRAERELAAATARIGAAEAERLPRVSLSGSIALQGPDIGDAVNPDASILQFGPSISLPIFEGGRIRSRVLQAESEQRQALLRLEAAVLGAFSEVETASVQRSQAERRVERLASAEAKATEAETLAMDRYEAGASDFLDVTESRSQRLAIARDRVVAEREATLRLIELYAALGGGWPTGAAQARAD